MIVYAKTALHKWIILPYPEAPFAWSGSRWVPIGGDIQICNFETQEQAEAFAWGKRFPEVAPQ